MLFVNSAQLQNISDAAGTAFLARSAEMLATPDTSITQNVADIKQITGANNYTSIVPYYHPDPNSASGFPYIRRDGVRNQEAAQTSDSRYVYTMLYAVQNLVIAHQLTGDDSYAARAIAMLRVFFMDPATKMNPDLTYSQVVFGASRTDLKIRGAIIDFDRFPIVGDFIEILSATPTWTPEDTAAMQAWFTALVGWFVNSPRGIIQDGYSHNIKTSYVTQRVAYLCAAGERDNAIAYLNSRVPALLDAQIDAEGKQALEMSRVTNRRYCEFNLTLLCRLATMASNLGVDLWNHVGDNGVGSIKTAMLYMAQFVTPDAVWPFSPETLNSASSREWLRYGIAMYDDPTLLSAYAMVRMYGITSLPNYITTPPGQYIERA